MKEFYIFYGRKDLVYLFMSERICVKKRETLQKYEALPEKSKKKEIQEKGC